MKKLIIICFCLFFICGCIEYSSGSRAGELVKFSEKGLFFKSGEGEIVINAFPMRGQVSSNKSSNRGNVFDFSVDNNSSRYKELVDKLNNAIGKQVEIKYIQEAVVSPFRASTKYLVTDIKIIE